MKTIKIICALSLLLCASHLHAAEQVPVPANETSKETAISLLQQVFAAYQARQPLKAVQLLGQAQNLAREQNDKPSEALILFLYGGLYEKMGLSDQTKESEAQARVLLTQVNNPSTSAIIFTMIGRVYHQVGQLQRATQLYEEAITLSHAAGDKAVEGFALVNLGHAEQISGQLPQSLQHLLQATRLLHDVSDVAGEAQGLLFLAFLQENLGDRKKMRDLMQQSLALLQRPRVEQKKQINTLFDIARQCLFDPKIIEADDLIALDALDDRPLSERILLLERALLLVRDAKNQAKESTVLECFADCYRDSGQRQKSNEMAAQSLTLALETGHKGTAIGALRILAWNAEESQHLTESMKYKKQALQMCQELGNLDNEAWSWGDIATTAEDAGLLDEAKQARLAQLTIFERQREHLGGSDAAKANYLEDKLRAYRSFISLLLKRGEVAEALAWTEKSKARALLDLMQNGKVDISASATDEEKQRQGVLIERCNSLTQQMIGEGTATTPNQEKIKSLKIKLTQAESELQAYNQTLYAAHPDRATRRAAQTVNLDGIRQFLPPDTAILSYVILPAPERLVLFCVTLVEGQPKVQTYDLAQNMEALAETLDDFRDACSHAEGKYRFKAQSLYTQLIAPANHLLEGKTRLIICPDGPLWDTPFGALRNGDKFLAESYELDFSYSATALQSAVAANKGTPNPLNQSLLVFANPDFGGAERFRGVGAAQSRPLTADSRPLTADSRPLIADARALTADSRDIFTREGGILPLPGTQREADALKETYPDAEIDTGKAAQEVIAKAQSGNYRYLHFATHGLFSSTNPMLSSVVLAEPPTGSNEDGLLTAREIFDLKLHADLVVLSACNTGRGEKKSGEGVIGLTWALFVAGTPSQVVSQWAVNDSSTAKLMSALYANLKGGKAKGVALREAELLLMKEKPHPYFWAPFVLMGDWRN